MPYYSQQQINMQMFPQVNQRDVLLEVTLLQLGSGRRRGSAMCL